MPPRVGDLVHVAGFGTGIVREVRNAGRCLVEIKGRAMVVREQQLAPATPKRSRGTGTPPTQTHAQDSPAHAASTLDLHGFTVEEALDALDRFLNDALLAGVEEARVIHGISGGRIKAAVHRRLKQLASVRGFRVDPSNPGVTEVRL